MYRILAPGLRLGLLLGLLLSTLLAAVPAAALQDGPAMSLTFVSPEVRHPVPGPGAPLGPEVFYAVGAVPSYLTPFGDRLFFTASDDATGGEPWVSDGTVLGTRLLGDLCPGECTSYPVPIGVLERPEVDDLVFFWASTAEEGREPWVSDGTPEGTRLLADLCPGECGSEVDPAQVAPESTPWWNQDRTVVDRPLGLSLGGELLFGTVEVQQEVWTNVLYASDGTAEGTRRIGTVCDPDCVRPPFDFVRGGGGDRAYFTTSDIFGVTLWASDGTVDGTFPVGVPCPSVPEVVSVSGDAVAFRDGVAFRGGCVEPFGVVEWNLYLQGASDAVTPLGLEVGEAMAVLDDLLYVTVPVPGTTPRDWELWSTDGTPGGTRERLDLPGFVNRMVPAPGGLYLLVGGTELYWTDGSGEPVRVSEAPLSLDVPVRVAEGLAFFWERSEEMEDFIEWRLVSHSPEAGRDVVQVFGSSIRRYDDGAGQEALVPPTTAVVEDRLFLVGSSGAGQQLWVLDLEPLVETCYGDPAATCLWDGRFQVTVRFRNQHAGGAGGIARPQEEARAAAGDTGYFWFFRPENLELAVKVLDGRGANGHWWVFAGGTTDLEYDLTVRDLETGGLRTYFHAPGDLCGIVDTAAFAAAGQTGAGSAVSLGAPSATAPSATAPSATAPPAAAASPLTPPPPAECDWFDEGLACVGPGQRFSIRVDYVNQHAGGATGQGMAFPETADTAVVRFFPNGGVETMVKVLDGRPVNGHWWVLWGGLTNLGYTVEVLDRQTEEVRTFTNLPGSQCGGADTTAFAEAP